MRSTFLNPNRQADHIRKITDFLFAALIFIAIILLLGYFFHKGAGLAAEMLMDVDLATPGKQSHFEI